MTKRRITTLGLSVLLFLAVLLIPGVGSTSSKEKVYYINDYAGIISAETKTELTKLQQDTQKATNIAIVLVTYNKNYTSDQLGMQLINKVASWNLETVMNYKYIVVGVDATSKAIYTLPSSWVFQYMTIDQIKNISSVVTAGDPSSLVNEVVTLVNSNKLALAAGENFVLPARPKEAHVSDQSTLLSATQKAELNKTLEGYSVSTGVDIVLVTTPTLRKGTYDSLYVRIKAKWDLPMYHVVVIYDKSTSKAVVKYSDSLGGKFDHDLRVKINTNLSSSKDAYKIFTAITNTVRTWVN